MPQWFHRSWSWFVVLLVCCNLNFSSTAHSMEVDSFTAPPHPLNDIGPLVSTHIYSKLPALIKALNVKLFHLKSLRLHGRVTAPTSFVGNKFDPSYLLSKNEAWDFPETFIELWINYSRSVPSADRFSSPWDHSAYRGVHSPLPFCTTYIAPVINMYGIYIGSDKIGHFMQQGFEYYLVYLQAKSAGLSESDALAAAVKYGVHQENTYYGRTMSGIYSNGDLSANFAGLHFYLSLTHEITVYGKKVPPALIFKDDQWQFNPERHAELFLKPFITPHMSEAINPSQFEYNRDIVHKAIQVRCAQWKKAVPFVEKGGFVNYDLAHWDGLSYGFDLNKEKSIAFETECPEARAIIAQHFLFSHVPNANELIGDKGQLELVTR